MMAHGFHGFGPWLFGPMCLDRTPWLWECITEVVLHLRAPQEERKRKGLGDR
jgi:hypothetical protein